MIIAVQMREKMCAAVERGEPVAAVARRFEVTERGLRNIIKHYQTHGTHEPLRPGPKGPTKITPEDDATMLAMIKEDPGVTLLAIGEKIGVHESSVWRRLKTLGISLKKSH